MQAAQKGFTLIETMIGVSIVGILAAVAVSSYQNYTIRAQLTEGLSLASAVQSDVAYYYTTNGSWPTKLLGPTPGLGYDAKPTGKYVWFIDVDHGTVIIKYGNQASRTITVWNELDLRPHLSARGDAIIWVCGKQQTPADVTDPPVPSTPDNTSIPPQYLPSSCRL